MFSNFLKFKYAIAAVIFAAAISRASSSAIPMWEFLSRDEKMNHLYNTFVKQAAEYCKVSTMPDCNKVLLVYGLSNLAKMDDVSLDKMDPYQRGANDIIWESLMKGSYKTSEVKNTEHDYYADALEPSTDENYLGSDSNNVEEIQNSDHMVGPMVVRVRLDGSPVPNDETRYPKDEDMEEHVAMRSKTAPSLNDLITQNDRRPTTLSWMVL